MNFNALIDELPGEFLIILKNNQKKKIKCNQTLKNKNYAENPNLIPI